MRSCFSSHHRFVSAKVNCLSYQDGRKLLNHYRNAHGDTRRCLSIGNLTRQSQTSFSPTIQKHSTCGFVITLRAKQLTRLPCFVAYVKLICVYYFKVRWIEQESPIYHHVEGSLLYQNPVSVNSAKFFRFTVLWHLQIQ